MKNEVLTSYNTTLVTSPSVSHSSRTSSLRSNKSDASFSSSSSVNMCFNNTLREVNFVVGVSESESEFQSANLLIGWDGMKV